jgi:tetratricopeptide (TPR) repeat protein
VQDEITDAIVTAIEPQIYAAENFRSRRKPPNSVDAWDLVMRALSHHWRVTRPDSLAAQALLERAIAIDPNYGQALALFATNHMFGVHLGWRDLATAGAHCARQAALAAISADSEDAWAHTALGSVYFSTRRLDHSLAEFELALSSTRTSRWRRGTMPWRCAIADGGGCLCGDATRHPPEPARSLLPRSITALRPTPSSSEGIIRKRLHWRARRPVSAATSRAPIGF